MLLASGVACLIIGGIKEDDRRWRQRWCKHDVQRLRLVYYGMPWRKKVEIVCPDCGVPMEYNSESEAA